MKKLAEIGDLSPSFTEVSLRYITKPDRPERVKLTNPEAAFDFFMTVWNKDSLELKEEFIVVLLDNSKHVQGWCLLSSGGKSATVVDVSHVVTLALLGSASSVLIGHNHPSGNMTPSRSDCRLTEQIRDALKLMGLTIDDHLIISREKFYSFRMHGHL